MKVQKKACANCIHGLPVLVNYDVLCHFKGVVSRNYCCSKHRFVPEALKLRQKCIKCEYFIQSIDRVEEDENCGYCKLFTVRCFDGTKKNACSKFLGRSGITALPFFTS